MRRARHSAPREKPTASLPTGICGATERRPAKNASRTIVIFSITLPVQATGTSPAMECLWRSLERTSRTNLDQIRCGLAQHSHCDSVARFGQFVDGRRQSGKIRRPACRRPR